MHPHKIRAAVFDIDGTLAMMDKDTGTYEALPGAVEALEACRARGMPAVAYTNGTFFPPAHYYPLLADAGLVLEPGHMVTPAVVAARQLRKLGHERVMVTGAEGTIVPLVEAGIEVVGAGPGAGKVDAVLLAWARDFGLAHLDAAAQAVWDGAALYATSVAPFFAGAGGKRLLGVSGAMAAALKHATGVEAEVFGKPATTGVEIVTDITGVPAEETVVIGDDPRLEIRMGRAAGSFCVGVTTGFNDRSTFESYPEAERAQLVVESLEGLFGHEALQ